MVYVYTPCNSFTVYVYAYACVLPFIRCYFSIVCVARDALLYRYVYTMCFTLSAGHCVLQRKSANHSARTAMHVIMNAGQLFVLIPSSGNIGHFEFSIFNALVNPTRPLPPCAVRWFSSSLVPLRFFPLMPSFPSGPVPEKDDELWTTLTRKNQLPHVERFYNTQKSAKYGRVQTIFHLESIFLKLNSSY